MHYVLRLKAKVYLNPESFTGTHRCSHTCNDARDAGNVSSPTETYKIINVSLHRGRHTIDT